MQHSMDILIVLLLVQLCQLFT